MKPRLDHFTQYQRKKLKAADYVLVAGWVPEAVADEIRATLAGYGAEEAARIRKKRADGGHSNSLDGQSKEAMLALRREVKHELRRLGITDVMLAERWGLTRERIGQVLGKRARVSHGAEWFVRLAEVLEEARKNDLPVWEDVALRLRKEIGRRRLSAPKVAAEVGVSEWALRKLRPEAGPEYEPLVRRMLAWIEASEAEPGVPSNAEMIAGALAKIKARGITKSQAAREIGITPQHFNSLQNGLCGREMAARVRDWVAAE